MTFTPHTYVRRRADLASRHPQRAFVLPAHTAKRRNNTVDYPFRQHSDLLYLTGVNEPDVALVIAPDAAGGRREVLFARPADAERTLWWGDRAGLEAAHTLSGVADVRPWDRLWMDLPELLLHAADVGWRLGVDAQRDLPMLTALEQARQLRPRHARETAHLAEPHRRLNEGLAAIVDPRDAIGELRLRKDAAEIEHMRRAGAASAAAHVVAMHTARPADSGRALAGRIEAALLAHGADATSYNTIVAVADEALCLHAHPSTRRVDGPGLVLVDAAGEVDGYAADITRTFPIAARFDGAAADLYAVILAAERAGIAAVKPGSTLEAVHRASCDVLAAGLRDLGVAGPLERYFPHPTSHWIGLDVHDVGVIHLDGAQRPLEPGMAFSVEPGLYLPARDDVPERLRGLAIRVEDTVLVTADGAEVLTGVAPTETTEIERLRAEALAGHRSI